MELVWKKVHMNMAAKLWVPLKERKFPEQLGQLWLLQDGVSKSNVHRKIRCGHLSWS
jgi:hypothetical protein